MSTDNKQDNLKLANYDLERAAGIVDMTENLDPVVAAQMAQAAALIAIAERLDSLIDMLDTVGGTLATAIDDVRLNQ